MKASLRHLLGGWATAMVLTVHALPAQGARASATAVAQIADAALAGVLTPAFSRLTTIEERAIRFDRQRTMAAFGATDDATPLATLGFRRNVGTGSQELLDDCNQAGRGTCAKLVGSTYVFLEPVSMTDTAAVVWLHFVSASKGNEKYGIMSAVSTQVHLAKSNTGAWRFVRTGLSARS